MFLPPRERQTCHQRESWWAFLTSLARSRTAPCLNQGMETEGRGISAGSCSCSHLGLPPDLPSEAQASWQPEGQLALPFGEVVPLSTGPVLLMGSSGLLS